MAANTRPRKPPIAHGVRLAEEGADILDIGGESTRPGADEVPLEEELRRVIPVIEALVRATSIPISVDTSKPEVMRAAVAAGAGMINDVYALRRDGALDAAASLGVPVVLMHMLGEPRSMQDAPVYDEVVVRRAPLPRRADLRGGDGGDSEVAHRGRSRASGSARTATTTWPCSRGWRRIAELGVPVLAGLSRKKTIGDLTGRADPHDRVAGSVAAHLIAAQRGAKLVRVHDVAPTVDALKVWAAIAAQPAVRAREAKPAIRWPDED